MNAVLDIDPRGLYTGAQAIAATGIPRNTFYRWIRIGRIPKHLRKVDSRPVFKGSDLLNVLTATVPVMPEVRALIPKRGRPVKK